MHFVPKALQERGDRIDANGKVGQLAVEDGKLRHETDQTQVVRPRQKLGADRHGAPQVEVLEAVVRVERLPIAFVVFDEIAVGQHHLGGRHEIGEGVVVLGFEIGAAGPIGVDRGRQTHKVQASHRSHASRRAQDITPRPRLQGGSTKAQPDPCRGEPNSGGQPKRQASSCFEREHVCETGLQKLAT